MVYFILCFAEKGWCVDALEWFSPYPKFSFLSLSYFSSLFTHTLIHFNESLWTHFWESMYVFSCREERENVRKDKFIRKMKKRERGREGRGESSIGTFVKLQRPKRMQRKTSLSLLWLTLSNSFTTSSWEGVKERGKVRRERGRVQFKERVSVFNMENECVYENTLVPVCAEKWGLLRRKYCKT